MRCATVAIIIIYRFDHVVPTGIIIVFFISNEFNDVGTPQEKMGHLLSKSEFAHWHQGSVVTFKKIARRSVALIKIIRIQIHSSRYNWSEKYIPVTVRVFL